MNELFISLTHVAMSQTLAVFSNPNVRNYWVFLACGILLAIFAGRGPKQHFTANFFTAKAWLSASARNDYVFWFANPILRVVTILVLGTAFPFIGQIETMMQTITTALSAKPLPAIASDTFNWFWMAALTAWIFLVTDLARWITHYLFHKIPALWELHKVHHSAEALNFATAERFHPFETLISGLVIFFMVWLANVSFLLAVGSAGEIGIFGANILWILANMAGGAFRHAPIWISYGPALERWFISPAMHQIHHSGAERHWGRNMGSTLTIWDRLAGTYYRPDGYEALAFGIGEETAQYRTVASLYVRPLRQIARLANRRPTGTKTAIETQAPAPDTPPRSQ